MKKISSIFMVLFVVLFAVGCGNKSSCKKDYDLSTISFNDTNVVYDGNEHCILIDGELPDGVEVEYENNKLINAGSVTATATIKKKGTSKILKVFDATLTVAKRNVKIKVSDVLIISNDEVLSNNYEVVEGSFVDTDFDKLNLNIGIIKQFVPVFATKYYNVSEVLDIECNLKSNYEITIVNNDITIHNTSFLSSDMIVYSDGTSYDEEYFESLNNFLSYDDLMERIKTYDVNSENYICPFDFGEYNLDSIDEFFIENPDKLEEVMNVSRYTKELKYLTSYFSDNYKFYGSKVKAVKDWIMDILGLLYVDYRDIIVTETPYEFVKSKGYEGTEEEFIEICEDPFYSLSYELSFDGFDDCIENVEYLAATLLKYPSILPGKLDGYDATTYPEDYLKYLEFEHYNDLVSQKLKTLPNWYDYKNVLLGYGGVETDYPNKPVLTSVNEDGNIVEFYFNYLDTTFKFVEKDLDGNVIKMVNSSSEDSVLELKYKNDYRFIVHTYSNYDNSVADQNYYNNFVKPDYLMYLEKDEFGKATKLLVSYSMSMRGFTPYDFPTYISKEKMDEYFKRNETLAIQGAVTSNGELIEDIKSNNRLYAEFCSTELSYYIFVPAIIEKNGKKVSNPANLFGFDYYKLNASPLTMSKIVFTELYKCLYEYCGYTEEDLISDNNEFNMGTKVYKPVFKVTVEYKLIDGILYVSIPENSIYNDEQNQIYSIELLKYAQIEE